MPRINELQLAPGIDGDIHYQGATYQDDGEYGSKYVMIGGSLWHVFALHTDGSLYSGRQLRRLTPLHAHIQRQLHVQHLRQHHASHLRGHKFLPPAPCVRMQVTVNVQAAPKDHPGFQDQHRRAILRTQGVIDIAAGTAGTIESVAIVSAILAPETGGASVAIGAAILLTYGIFRGFGQIGAGLDEVLGSHGTDEHVKETQEDAEHLKTLTSLSGFTSTAADTTLGKKIDWSRAGNWADGETLLYGAATANPAEEGLPFLNLSRNMKRVQQIGDWADKTDQTHTMTKQASDHADYARRRVEQLKQYLHEQNQRRRGNSTSPNHKGVRSGA